VLLTWAADERCNRAVIRGTGGEIELLDDTLVLTRGGVSERWMFPSGLSDGSHHPEWFGTVADRFVAEMSEGTDGANLAEASLCVAVEAIARRSSCAGGVLLPLPPLSAAHPERSR
jgi:hypothetical protein